MDCKSFEENISVAVDRSLSKEEMDSFLEHARQCSGCRYEYEMESITKAVVGTKVRRVRAPAALSEAIQSELEQTDHAAGRAVPRWWQGFFQKPIVRPAIAFVVFFVAVILLVAPPETPVESPRTASLVSQDILLQSFANYLAVVRGDMQPQLQSDQPELLRSLFSGKTTFTVLVPDIKDCSLIGGVLDDHGGGKFAHVVYRRNAEIVYIYEACWKTMQEGSLHTIPAAVQASLQQNTWYTENRPDGHAIVVWAKGGTMCVAIARMDKDDLLACLSTEDSGGW